MPFALHDANRIMGLKNRVECGDYNCTIYGIYFQKRGVGMPSDLKN